MGAGIAQVFAVAGAVVTVVGGAIAAAAAAARDRVAMGLLRAAERGKLRRTAGGGAGPGRAGPRRRRAAGRRRSGRRGRAGGRRAEGAGAGRRRGASSATEPCWPPTPARCRSPSWPAALRRPERFIGMHFFNPVPAIEAGRGRASARETAEACARPRRWRGSPRWARPRSWSRDSPGFATSRLGVLLGLEAIRMLEEGVADAESIDRAMELGLPPPDGPAALHRPGRPRRAAGDRRAPARELGERFAPPALLREKVARGELGRKTGQGFYHWD